MPAVVLTTKRATSLPAPSGRAWSEVVHEALGHLQVEEHPRQAAARRFGNDLGPAHGYGPDQEPVEHLDD